MSATCLVRGSINIDEFFHLPHIVRPGETISSASLSRGAGGKGANQAYACAKAGGNVVLEGHIGSDGLWVRDLLEQGGVKVDRVEVLKDEVTGRAVIQSSADGENSIILHKGANYHYPSDTTPKLDGITHLVLQNEIDPRITTSYLSAAGAQGITTIYNPSPMPSPEELRSFPWSALTWLIVNEGEMGDLLAAFGIQHDAGSDTEDISLDFLTQRVAAGLQKLSSSSSFAPSVNIICTLGAQGIMYSAKPQGAGGEVKTGHLPAAKVINGVKDTTGAGDCFAGYFAAGLMNGDDLEVVLRTCLTACAMCVEKAGAMGSVPSRAEVEQRGT